MKSTIILNSEETEQIADGKITAFYVLVKPQPNEVMYNPIVVGDSRKYHGICDEHGKQLKLPYTLNKPIYIREPWGFKRTYPIGVEYEVYEPTTKIKSKSAATMPKTAARLWIEPIDVRAMRIQELHEDDILQFVESKNIPTGGDDYMDYYRNYLGSQKESDFPYFTGDPFKSLESYHIKKYGEESWKNNDYVLFYTFKLINNENAT